MRLADARELFLRGTRFPAAKASEVGLITSAVDDGDLDAAVDEIVADLVRGGPEALAACKTLIGRVPTMPRAEAFAWAAGLSTELFGSDEAAEGIAAFLDRRSAAWVPEPGSDR